MAACVPAVTGGAHGPRAEATAVVLEAMRAARMPVVLTLDQARSGGVAGLPVEATVYICENPSVVEVVADRWAAQGTARGGRGPVLVCTWGQPSTAVVELLTILTAVGAAGRYHGDFDWPGLRIAGALRERIGWTPWDPRLATAMAEHGRAIEEEAVVHQLAGDLLASSGHLG